MRQALHLSVIAGLSPSLFLVQTVDHWDLLLRLPAFRSLFD
jgi:hypothetical protein